MMQPKNYYYKLIKNNKIKSGSDVVLPNGDIDLHLILSQKDSTPKPTMTNNDLAKIVEVLVTTVNDLTSEMREGFKKVDKIQTKMNTKIDNMQVEMNNRFDKIEQRLDEHDAIFERNNLK